MIENLQDEPYQLENKEGKGAKLCDNIRWELEDEKCSKTFFNVFKRHLKNQHNQTTSELYTDDNKQQYSSNLEDIFKSAKKCYRTLYTKEKSSKALTTKFFSKISNKKSNEQYNLSDAKISLNVSNKWISR